MKRTVFNIVPEKAVPRDPMDTVCEFKWNYPIFQVDRGEFRSCCRTPSRPVSEEQLQEKGINAFLNSDHLIQSRMDLIKGIRHDDCKTCWKLEDQGMKSPREPDNFRYFMGREGLLSRDNNSIEQAKEELSKINSLDHKFLNAKRPYMMEISLGNTCDLKCMYCNHHYSTQWATESIKLGEITQEQYDREFPAPPESFESTMWQWFDQVGRFNIHRINIIGGEPLIIPKFYEYLDIMKEKLAPLKSIRTVKPTLCIVTNLNTPPNYFKRFLESITGITDIFNLEVLVSMESLGSRAEYIRNGINWKRFESNVDQLFAKKDVKFNVGFLMTISALSVATTKTFVEYATELSKKHDRPVGLKQNLINFPRYQSPMILPPSFAKYIDEAVEYMEQHVDAMPDVEDFHGRYDQYIIFLKKLSDTLKTHTDNYAIVRREFYHWFTEYNRRRDLDLVETFPEYKDFFEYCGKL
jgi:hypothetical protein